MPGWKRHFNSADSPFFGVPGGDAVLFLHRFGVPASLFAQPLIINS